MLDFTRTHRAARSRPKSVPCGHEQETPMQTEHQALFNDSDIQIFRATANSLRRLIEACDRAVERLDESAE
jgi:hypothetical protein